MGEFWWGTQESREEREGRTSLVKVLLLYMPSTLLMPSLTMHIRGSQSSRLLICSPTTLLITSSPSVSLLAWRLRGFRTHLSSSLPNTWHAGPAGKVADKKPQAWSHPLSPPGTHQCHSKASPLQSDLVP